VQFDTFENAINSNTDINLLSANIPVVPSPRSDGGGLKRTESFIRDSRGDPATRARSRPALINSNVRDIFEPMEVDQESGDARRKRPVTPSQDEVSQETSKVKKLSTNSSNSSPRATDPGNTDKIKYSSTDNPPFVVHVHSFAEDPTKQLHPLLISRTLSRLVYSDIKEIKKIGKGKVMAEMNSAKAANDLINDSRLEKEGLKAFIPTYRTIRSGIVKDIPQHFDESDLLEFFDAPCKVVAVRRLNRRIRINGETQYVPSRTVCLKFAGQLLPKYIFFCRIRHEVYPFIPKVQICFSCYRIGHISKVCKGKPRCLFCGGDAHEDRETCPNRDAAPRCINCQGEHLATSHTCPVVSKHKMVLSLAATENIPIIEAKRRVQQSTPTLSPSSPSQYSSDFINFPLLEHPKPHNSNGNWSADDFHSDSQFHNRFSPLSSSNTPESNYSSTSARPEQVANKRKKKLSFSQAVVTPKRISGNSNSTNSDNGNNNPSAHTEKTKHNPRAGILLYPNGRPIKVSGNGVGYGLAENPHASQSVSVYAGSNDQNISYTGPHPSYGFLHALNELNNKISTICSIDFDSLNNSISNLAQCLHSFGQTLAKVQPILSSDQSVNSNSA